MKTILKDLTDSLEMMLGANETSGGESKQEEKRKELEEDDMLELLQELRDIVEQIDYARAFMAIGGLPFLLGCATYQGSESNGKAIPMSIRKGALGVLSTMSQNNPPVQLSLLEHGHIPELIELFLDYTPGNDRGNDGNDSIREKAVQALSASIRSHSIAEHAFCKNELGKLVLQLGLGMQQKTKKPSTQLRKRALFLLRALLTSDDSTDDRLKEFTDIISFICTHEIDDKWEGDGEIREMSLEMLSQMLSNNPSQSTVGRKVILQHKDHIASIGVFRIQTIRSLDGGSEEREYAALELEAWESLMVALAEAEKEGGNDGNSKEPVLALM